MAKTAVLAVTSYIAGQPRNARAVLTRVRRVIRRAIPDVEEVISRRPARGPRCARREYGIKNSTIRFPPDKPVPAALIGRIAKFRAGNKSSLG